MGIVGAGTHRAPRSYTVAVSAPTDATQADATQADVPRADAPSAPRQVGRSARWALGGLTVAGLAYVGIVDPSRPNLLPGCAFNALTGLDCPGCGGTRAVHSLLRGDVVAAVNHNVLVVVTLVVAAVWLAWNRLAPRVGGRALRPSLSRTGAIALFGGLATFWVVRNLPWAPFDWLGAGL